MSSIPSMIRVLSVNDGIVQGFMRVIDNTYLADRRSQSFRLRVVGG